MSDTETGPSSVMARGARPSLIEEFGIEKLHGYRSISLSSAHAATILIAKNGTGKTTLLGALYAFLRLQLGRLRDLEFDRIHCKIRDHGELSLSHDDILDFIQIPNDTEFSRVSRRISTDTSALFSFLVNEWPLQGKGSDLFDYQHPIYSKFLTGYNYQRPEIQTVCDKLKEELYLRKPQISTVWTVLKSALHGHDIVYLPTYRRVELALIDEEEETPYSKRRAPKFALAAGGLFSGDIQFGLRDISDRLSELNQRIIIDSNTGYREISANIIKELIDGTFEKFTPHEENLPSDDELTLFFSRLKDSRQVSPFPISTPDIDKLYIDDAVAPTSKKFLEYFLSKLGTVIKATRNVERPVDAFVDNCNKYLRAEEPSTDLSDGSWPDVGGKKLKLNRRNLKVRVESLPEGRDISLDALSSGEKQMISLFAKLYLYPGPKLVLIDEPELSLSIDWQMQILVDVLNAPLCEQVIAITHSPFVFDNDLEPFAKSLRVTKVLAPQTSPDDDSDVDGDFSE